MSATIDNSGATCMVMLVVWASDYTLCALRTCLYKIIILNAYNNTIVMIADNKI